MSNIVSSAVQSIQTMFLFEDMATKDNTPPEYPTVGEVLGPEEWDGFIASFNSQIPVLDQRVKYVLFVFFLPLLIAIATALPFKSGIVQTWYIVLIITLGMFFSSVSVIVYASASNSLGTEVSVAFVFLVFSLILLVGFSIWTIFVIVTTVIKFIHGRTKNDKKDIKTETNTFTLEGLENKENKEPQENTEKVKEKQEPQIQFYVEEERSVEEPKAQKSKTDEESAAKPQEVEKKSEKSIVEKYEEEKEKSMEVDKTAIIFKVVCHSGFCLGFILLLFSFFISLIVIMAIIDDLPNPFLVLLFILMLIPCIVIPVSFFISLTPLISRVRKISYYVWEFFLAYGLKIAILLLGFIYIPISKQLYGAFMCQQHSCDPGYYPFGLIPFVFDRRSLGYGKENPTCVPCGLTPFSDSLRQNISTGFDQTIYNSFCTGRYSFRLQADTLVQCTFPYMITFFTTSAIFALVFIVGFPIVICLTVRKASSEIRKVEIQHIIDENVIYQKEEKIKSDQKKREYASDWRVKYPIFAKVEPILIKLKLFPEIENSTQSNDLTTSRDNPNENMVEEDLKVQETNDSMMSPRDDSLTTPRPNDSMMSPRDVPMTDELVKETKEEPKKEEENKEMTNSQKSELEWKFQLAAISLPTAGFFDYIQYRYRYFHVFKTFEKVLIVAVLTFPLVLPPPFRLFATAAAILYYIGMIVMIIILRPYISKLQTIFEVAITVFVIINTFLMTITSFLSKTSIAFVVFQYIIYCVQIPLAIIGIGLMVYQIIGSMRFGKLVKTLEKRLAEKDKEGIKALQVERKIRAKLINKTTINYFVNFLLIVGFLCIFFGSLAISITLGESQAAASEDTFDNSFFGQTTVYETRSFPTCSQAISNEFVGYKNWETFTSNCCCTRKNHTKSKSEPTTMYLYDELWLCNNKATKSRMRSVDSINNVRGFCAKDFKTTSYNQTCVYLTTFGRSPSISPIPLQPLNIRSIHYHNPNSIVFKFDPFW
eukprot:gene6282-10289_t